jgi:hypothetical protein
MGTQCILLRVERPPQLAVDPGYFRFGSFAGQVARECARTLECRFVAAHIGAHMMTISVFVGEETLDAVVDGLSFDYRSRVERHVVGYLDRFCGLP